MPPLEAWEKVLVKTEFLSTTHGKQACTTCHGGVQQAASKDQAHQGLVAKPSSDPKGQCQACHAQITTSFSQSLHATQQGYWTSLEARSTPENKPVLQKMFGNHCASCHTSCGECHVSQPNSVGAGFLDGHLFEKTPPMTRTCTACHGSRVGNEYLGKHEDIPGDVHFREARLTCTACHTSAEIHATPQDSAANRYAGMQQPLCTSCHKEVGAAGDANQQHLLHKDKLSCQVCHSITYDNCDACHVAVSKDTGNPFFKTDKDYLGFFIGKNPLKSANRPYNYVPVRHIPVAPDSYAYYGENLLPNFDKLSTWAYATPHNIQLKTPQNASCNSCHGNNQLFLTADKVAPAELKANKAVIVDVVPPAR